MNDYRGFPEYAEGYGDGLHGRPKQWRYLLDAAYDKGYFAGMNGIRSRIRKRSWFDIFGV